MAHCQLRQWSGGIGFFVFISLLLAFVAQVAAQPVPCHHYTYASIASDPSPFPSGFGVPWNVLDTTQLLLKAFCTSSSETADIGPATYIYNQGYAYANNQWYQTTFTCTGGTIVQSAWCPNSASAPLPNNSTWYLAYTCNWTGTKWMCGCRDPQCSQNFWQLQRFSFVETSRNAIALQYALGNQVFQNELTEFLSRLGAVAMYGSIGKAIDDVVLKFKNVWEISEEVKNGDYFAAANDTVRFFSEVFVEIFGGPALDYPLDIAKIAAAFATAYIYGYFFG